MSPWLPVKISGSVLEPGIARKTVSRFATWIFGKFFAHRQKISNSIRNQAGGLQVEQQKVLMQLLRSHGLIKLKFDWVDAQSLRQFHFCKTITKKQINDFIVAFNAAFEGSFIITVDKENFGLITAPPKPAVFLPGPTTESTATADLASTQEIKFGGQILGLLQVANKPLTLAEIKDNLNIEATEAVVAIELGRSMERGSVLELYHDPGQAARYVLADRLPQFLGRTVFAFARDLHRSAYIYQSDAQYLLDQGLAFTFLESDGSKKYASKDCFDQVKAVSSEILGTRRSLWTLKQDLQQLLAAGVVVRGKQDGSFEECFIYSAAQDKHAYKVFNAFAQPYLTRTSPDDFRRNYQRLRAAFDAGLKSKEMVKNVAEFLYEAQVVSKINGHTSLTAIVIALTGNEKGARLLSGSVFAPGEIRKIINCHQRLEFVFHHPTIFAPGFAHSLQNYIDFLYDQTEYYEVFQMLLVRKLNQLRGLKPGPKAPYNAYAVEAEMIFAPMADSKGFLALASNVRELAAKLVDPAGHMQAHRTIEEFLGMNFLQARRYLGLLAQDLKRRIEEDLADYGVKVFAVESRVKEVASFKGKAKAKELSFDDLFGIRLVCETLEQADHIVAWLQEKLAVAPRSDGTAGIRDNLRKNGSSGGLIGWGRYFWDPMLEADEPNRRRIDIHIQTREMQKEDKRGQAAHWSYKAARAGLFFAKTLSRLWGLRITRQQRFDPAPIAEYNGEPEHDYYVDRDHARRYKRAFVWQNELGSINSFNFSKDRILFLPVIRLVEGATVDDVVAFRAFGNSFLEGYSHCGLYSLQSDPKQEGIILNSRGKVRAAHGADVPNGSIVVVNYAKLRSLGLSPEDLAVIERTAKALRTRLLVAFARSESGKNDLIGKGKTLVLGEKLDTEDKKQEALKATELRDEDELYAAIALGLIDGPTIDRALGILETKVSLEALAAEGIKLTIESPDFAGQLLAVLDQLAGFEILSANFKTEIQARGAASPARTEIIIRPAGRKGRRTQPDIGKLRSRLERSRAQALPWGQDDISETRLMITLKQDWSLLRAVAETARSYNFNILSLELPKIGAPADSQPGKIVMENRGAAMEVDELVALITLDLADKIPPDSFTVEAIS